MGEQDPTYLPDHVAQAGPALSAVVSSNSGVDLTRREGPGGRKSEFVAGAARGAANSPLTQKLAKNGGGLRKLFAGAAAVE